MSTRTSPRNSNQQIQCNDDLSVEQAGCPGDVAPPSSALPTITDSLKNASILKELHDSVEQELIAAVSRWSHRVVIVLPGAASFVLFAYGQESFVNPAIVSLTALVASIFFSIHIQWVLSFVVFTLIIVKHSLSQGCTASLVPAIYGFLPCAFGLLFRTRRAVIMSTLVVLMGVLVIFTIDLSGHCISQPIVPSQKALIVADRLFPLLVLILGNSAVLIAMVQQSRKSLLLHAKAAQSAAKLADVRKDVLHRVTHELRTPLNGLVGSVELLVTSTSMNQEDMENALVVKSCLQNIVRICDNVLLAAKSSHHANTKTTRISTTNSSSSRTSTASTNQDDDKEEQQRQHTDAQMTVSPLQKIKETPFSLASCVDDVTEIFRASAAAKMLKLRVEFRGNTLTRVFGMQVELRQVLLNLVGNAMKFTDLGGITIRVVQQDIQPPTAAVDAVRFKFEVIDTGIGIAPENASIIFEAFQQGEQDVVSRQHKGTGLGLTICRDLVAVMGGKINVDGARGKGCRFFFTLEFKQDTKSFLEKNKAFPDTRNGIRVVIADSENESRTCCQSIVASIAPSADITTVASSVSDVLGSTKTLTKQHASDIRIALVECDGCSDGDASALCTLKANGWLVIAYCDHDGFSRLIEDSMSSAIYASFRRPLPLVRLGEIVRNAMDSLLRQSQVAISCQHSKLLDVSRKSTSARGELGTCSVGEKRKSSHQMEPVVEFRRPAKVVVVDDTPVNVKVLVKMLTRTTTVPIMSCFNGQSAVDLVSSSGPDELLLFLLDWHMPGICGLSATDSIRRIVKERGFPTVYVCMVTADIEGLRSEMDRRNIHCEGTISKGELIKDGDLGDVSTTESEEEVSRQLERTVAQSDSGFTVIDIVAEKPVTFSSIQAILSWFQRTVEETTTGSVHEKQYPVSATDT